MENYELLHERALATAKEFLKREAELVGIFQELDEQRTFEKYGMPSLFAYSTKVLGLSEATTTALTSIARTAKKVPELKTAIEEKKITFSNARRIAPVLNLDNKSEWLEKAAKLSNRALELDLAKSFPERPAPTRIYPKSETSGRLEVDLSHAVLANLKRAQEILSQKKKTNIDTTTALELLIAEFIERHDPMEKTKRARPTVSVREPVTRLLEKSDTILLMRRMGIPVPRRKIPAKERHKVSRRDGGQCTYCYSDGSRCESRQWLELHHVKPHAHGGLNIAENLRTLCSAHHSRTHT